MKKKSNPYKIEDVMLKHSITRDEAILKIKELKNKTKGTLENFIKRHGEIKGKELFDIFKEKSRHTEETFKKKYGDNWKIHWEKYLKSKSSGLDVLIKKHGEEEGRNIFHKTQEKRKNSLNVENLIKKFGKDGYKNIIEKKKSGSLNFFIKKYGKKEGILKYKECCEKKSKSNFLKYYIEKYGEEVGETKYNESRMKRSPIFKELQKLYGETNALEIYNSFKNKKEITKKYNLEIKNLKKARNSIFFKKSKGCVSKESKKLFNALEEKLKRKLIYGNKKKEVKIFDKINFRTYHYDCYDEKSNTLIEFHGVAYHPKKDDINWTSPYGRTYEEAFLYDNQKEECAISNGFNYIKIYSDEVKLKHDFEKKIKEISDKLII